MPCHEKEYTEAKKNSEHKKNLYKPENFVTITGRTYSTKIYYKVLTRQKEDKKTEKKERIKYWRKKTMRVAILYGHVCNGNK